jgi:hypothetical protein
VPAGWGRKTVLEHVAAAVARRRDAPDTGVVRIDGGEVGDLAGIQARVLAEKLITEARAWHRVASRLGLDGPGSQAALAIGIGGFFVPGLPSQAGLLLAETAAGALGRVWDNSPAGQDGALARTARAVAAASVAAPVIVLIDDADSLDVDLAVMLAENLAYRSDGQVLAVVAVNADWPLATRLRRHAPLALTGRVHIVGTDADMSYLARLSLVREQLPTLPDAAARRIGQRTQTFADVFAVTSHELLADVAAGTSDAAAVADADKAINARVIRGVPSAEAVMVAWAGGVVHARQADRAMAARGEARIANDRDLSHLGSLVRLADPLAPRLATQRDALAPRTRQAMAAAVLGEAVGVLGDPGAGLVDQIVAARVVHHVREDVSEQDRGQLVRLQCDLVAALESVGDLSAALDAAEEALAGRPPAEHSPELDALSGAVLRLAHAGAAPVGDPLVEELVNAAVAGGAVIGLEARIWAAINLLQMPDRRDVALSLTDQVTTDLDQHADLGSAGDGWRLLLASHAGQAGYATAMLPVLKPLLDSADTDVRDSAARVLRAGSGPGADIRLQIAILEPQLEAQHLSDDDKLRLHRALARAHWKLGDYRRARDHTKLELSLRVSLQGSRHPATLSTRHWLAGYSGLAGDRVGARDQYAALLPEKEMVLGPEHPDTLAARHQLADYTGLAGDPVGARNQYAALLPVVERVLGPEHRDTLAARHQLASYVGKAGDPVGARDQYAALLPEKERVLGPEHRDTLAARHQLASYVGKAGDPVGARDQYAALLPEMERVLGPQHPDTVTTRRELAYLTEQADDARAAAPSQPTQILS